MMRQIKGKLWGVVNQWVYNAVLSFRIRYGSLEEDSHAHGDIEPLSHDELLLKSHESHRLGEELTRAGRYIEGEDLEDAARRLLDAADALSTQKEEERVVSCIIQKHGLEKMAALEAEISAVHVALQAYQAWAVTRLVKRCVSDEQGPVLGDSTASTDGARRAQAAWSQIRPCPPLPTLEQMMSAEWRGGITLPAVIPAHAPQLSPYGSHSPSRHRRNASPSGGGFRSQSPAHREKTEGPWREWVQDPSSIEPPTALSLSPSRGRRKAFAYHSPPPPPPPEANFRRRLIHTDEEEREHKVTSDKKARLQVQVYSNDGVWANGPHLLSVTRLDELLTYATKKLELTWAGRVVYTKPEGKRIRAEDELYHGIEVVVSSGEEFRPFNIQAKAKNRKANYGRVNAVPARGPEKATGTSGKTTRNNRRVVPPPPPPSSRPGPAPGVVPV